MKKLLTAFFFSVFSLLPLIAGDAAAFLDIGFSADGKSYIFGEYGKTDKNFQAWAEIYAVDIAKNDFIPNGVFKTKPSSVTEGISGKAAYDSLYNRNKVSLNRFNCSPSDPENLLYARTKGGVIRPASPKTTDSIMFKDYEASTDDYDVYYRIKLIPSVTGKGVGVKSSFYITMQKEDENGNVLKSWKVGNPSIVRQGVSSYEIERIFTDDSGSSVVFVIQKTVEDETGTSIRYMVETIKI